MVVIGVNSAYHESSAALLVDGVLLAAAEEERFNRIKHCAGFPTEAVRYCLQEAGLGLAQIDVVTTSKDPGANRLAKVMHVLRHPAILSPAFLRSRLSQSAHIRDIGAILAQGLGLSSGQKSPELLHI